MSKTQGKALSRRAMVIVTRGLTDKTPLIVWQHEIPLLEAVHGEGQVEQITDAGIARMDEGFKAKKNDTAKRVPSISLGLLDVFDGDAHGEYERLAGKYGMHPQVKTSVVEYVYGRFDEGRFEKIVQGADTADLSERQLRNILVENYDGPITGEAFPPAANRDDLLKLVRAA